MTKPKLSPGWPALPLALLLATAPGTVLGQIATDRPDFVDSSLSLPHGAWQVEASLLWVEDESVDLFATPTLLRWGFHPDLEARVESGLFNWQRAPSGSGEGDDDFGVADVALGMKWHALDAAGWLPSSAVIAQVALPTGSSSFRGDGARPSVRAIGEWALPRGFGLGALAGAVYASGTEERFWAGMFGAVLGVAVKERGRLFGEFALPLVSSEDHAGVVGTWDAGFSWLVRDDMQVDVAVYLPATDRAPDASIGIGFSKLWNPGR